MINQFFPDYSLIVEADYICNSIGGVAQPDRAIGSYPTGRWFKSTPRHHSF